MFHIFSGATTTPVRQTGSAHFDEFTAVSLIVAVHANTGFRIERREPTTEELTDRSVWVVDIGGRHEPEKRIFSSTRHWAVPQGLY